MDKKELVNGIQAVLFASGEPVSIQRLALTFDVEPEVIQQTAQEISELLKDGPLEILTLENTYQLCTKKDYSAHIIKAFDIKRKSPLSQAALEVLAVIEQVRGVDCTGVISTLMEKELVEERGRLELPGRPLLYGTTKNFLRCFSINNLGELPEIPKDAGEPDIAEQLEAITD